jgi:hypothetical protein
MMLCSSTVVLPYYLAVQTYGVAYYPPTGVSRTYNRPIILVRNVRSMTRPNILSLPLVNTNDVIQKAVVVKRRIVE